MDTQNIFDALNQLTVEELDAQLEVLEKARTAAYDACREEIKQAKKAAYAKRDAECRKLMKQCDTTRAIKRLVWCQKNGSPKRKAQSVAARTARAAKAKATKAAKAAKVTPTATVNDTAVKVPPATNSAAVSKAALANSDFSRFWCNRAYTYLEAAGPTTLVKLAEQLGIADADRLQTYLADDQRFRSLHDGTIGLPGQH